VKNLDRVVDGRYGILGSLSMAQSIYESHENGYPISFACYPKDNRGLYRVNQYRPRARLSNLVRISADQFRSSSI